MDIAAQTRDPAAECLAPGRGSRQILRGVIGAAAIAVFAGAMIGPASAADSGDSTIANVDVGSSIALNGLTADFPLAGLSGATVASLGAVTFNVETNNFAGYTVTVQSEAATLAPADTVVNPDSIPIAALSVRQNAGLENAADYTPLSSTGSALVHSQDTRSDEGGDDLSNDYQIVIPFVNQDVYSVTLDYLAATQ
jgi:hypothetical protein